MNSDLAVKQDVEEELRYDPAVHAEQIGVSVKDQIVQLDGDVASFYEKWAAENAALRVNKVKGVANEIKVEPTPADKPSDADLAKAALNQLEWTYAVPNTVKVRVSNGWITLEGTVDAKYQKDEAERILRSLKGLKGLVNEIRIAPKVNANVVKNKIIHALKRSAALDARTIQIETEGDTVILRGRVRSWAEREEARRTAWSAPGVARVQDLITIGVN